MQEKSFAYLPWAAFLLSHLQTLLGRARRNHLGNSTGARTVPTFALPGNGENHSTLAVRIVGRLRLAYEMPALWPDIAYRSEAGSVRAQRAGAEDARKGIRHRQSRCAGQWSLP